MPTNRTPRLRAARTKITAVAIDLYAQGKQVKRQKPSEENHIEFVRIWNSLHLELGLKPWMTSPLDFDVREPPGEDANEIQLESWRQTSEAHHALESALRERRKLAREQRRRSSGGAPTPPVPAPPIAAAGHSEE